MSELILPTDIITEVRLNADKTELALISGHTAYVFVTSGDCCSYSWIEHVEDAENIIGKRVTRIENVDYEDEDCYRGKRLPISENDYSEDSPKSQEVLKYYITRFWSDDNKYMEIEFRNASNGYYDGEFDFEYRANIDELWKEDK